MMYIMKVTKTFFGREKARIADVHTKRQKSGFTSFIIKRWQDESFFFFFFNLELNSNLSLTFTAIFRKFCYVVFLEDYL